MSLDGYVAGPGDDMSFLEHAAGAEGVIERYIGETGAILAGRRAYDDYAEDPDMRPYGGAWSGPMFVLTHHPGDAREVAGWTVLGGSLAEAIAAAREAAAGKAVEIHSASIASQALDAGLVDEVHLHVTPVMLGQGVRVFSRDGDGPMLRFERISADTHDEVDDPRTEVSLVYRPMR